MDRVFVEFTGRVIEQSSFDPYANRVILGGRRVLDRLVTRATITMNRGWQALARRAKKPRCQIWFEGPKGLAAPAHLARLRRLTYGARMMLQGALGPLRVSEFYEAKLLAQIRVLPFLGGKLWKGRWWIAGQIGPPRHAGAHGSYNVPAAVCMATHITDCSGSRWFARCRPYNIMRKVSRPSVEPPGNTAPTPTPGLRQSAPTKEKCTKAQLKKLLKMGFSVKEALEACKK